MKKIYIYILLALLTIGCTKQDDVITNDNRLVSKSLNVYTEEISQSDTKAYIDNLKVVFEDDDKLAVFDKNTAISEYVYSTENDNKFGGDSENTGTSIDGVFALYPYSTSVTCDGTKIEASLPATQEYEANSFSNNSHIMFGVTDDVTDGITLKNMCGYIRLQLYTNEEKVIVKEIKLSTLKDGQFISGDFYISQEDNEAEYSLKMYGAGQEHSAQSGSVTLNCSAQDGGGVALGGPNNPTIFYIALPAQTYSNGFKITVTDIYGREITKSASTEFTLERSHIKPMAALGINMNSVITIETDANGNAYATAESTNNIFPIEKFLKWGYLANHSNNELGLKLTGNVNMPENEIEPDHENKTYKITDTPITVTDGVPSGSNWVPLKTGSDSDWYENAIINGNGYTITGLRINSDNTYVGFVGYMRPNVKIQNIQFDEAYVYSSNSYVGMVAGRAQDGTLIDNITVKNSHIHGKSNVGGIVGYNYRRIRTGIDEKLAIVSNCTIDKNSTVIGSSSSVGGICGYSYGAAIIECVNNADVTGSSSVGGIAGYHREFNLTHVNSYIIACASSENATITATNGSAGGLLGTSWCDLSNHPLAISYVVGCYSLSDVSDNQTAGSLIGQTYSTNDHIIASWAKEVSDKVIGNGNHTNISTEHFASNTDIDQDFVTQMNTAIDNYNNNVIDEEGDAVADIIKCHYKWEYNAGSWPTLVKVVEP